MGLLALNQVVSLQRDRHQIRDQSRFTPSTGKRKGSPCLHNHDDDSQAGKITRMTLAELPEDLLFRIHSLMPMCEAARAACLSHSFLHSWRHHSNLIFNKATVGLKESASGEKFHHKIDRILRKHKGSLKTLKLDYTQINGLDDFSYFDSWLQIALKPGLEELTFRLSPSNKKYNFPCALLCDVVRNSLRHLTLYLCVLHPTVELGPLKSLTSLSLRRVSITWNQLECLLSNSLALERLEITSCDEIKCLKLSCALQRLSRVRILACQRLRVIESKAPNLSSFYFRGCRLNFSLVETWQMKELHLHQSNLICDAHVKMPLILPNIETLVLESLREVVEAPMLPTKFLYLRHLTIILRLGSYDSRAYDYFTLVSFLDASPSLETLILDVTQRRMVHKSIFVDSQLRHMPEHLHGHLKSVKISAKCLVELTCYILKNAVSLECLTLDISYGSRCDGEDNWCNPMSESIRVEAPRALSAIRTYIENKVPSTVKLTVLEACSQCHVKPPSRVLSESVSCHGVVSV